MRIKLVINDHQKKVLPVIFVATICLIALLGVSALKTFSYQQNIYQQILLKWRSVEIYQNFLNNNDSFQIPLNLKHIEKKDLEDLTNIQNNYISLAGAIANDLSLNFDTQSQIVTKFLEKQTILLRSQKKLIDYRLEIINFKLCLSQNTLDLITEQQNFVKDTQALSNIEDTAQLKDLLKQTSNQADRIARVIQNFNACFTELAHKTEVKVILDEFTQLYQQYKQAIAIFISGIKELNIDKTKQALEIISQLNIDPQTTKKFDEFIKNTLHDMYTFQKSLEITTQQQFEDLKFEFRKIRLQIFVAPFNKDLCLLLCLLFLLP